jgi:hypothetical protein
MKQKSSLFILVLLLSLVAVSRSMAQSPLDSLAAMHVSFWPDYDDPSVLVLLTGTVPAGVTLPAEITVPIPADARVNAVAAVADGSMTTLERTVENGAVTFSSPLNQFRIEYYIPYDLNGTTRSYQFSWLSDLDVAEFSADVQQPGSASNLTTNPAAVRQTTGQTDGLIYHELPSRAVGAGMPFEVAFSYDLPSGALTAAPSVSTAGQQNVPAASSVPVESGTNWLLIGAAAVGVLALAVGGTWYVATHSQPSRRSSTPRKPAPRREPRVNIAAAARFCHVCGQPAEKGDQFCRKCGTPLK